MRKTAAEIMAAKPCISYSWERVEELVGDGIDEDQLLHLDIPDKNKLWALIYVWMSSKQAASFACDCAERALQKEREAGREPDHRSWEAIAVSRLYLDGEATKKEMDDAVSAAKSARDARNARVAKAVSATRAADRDAAWAACAAKAADRAAKAAKAANRAAKAAKSADRAANAAVMDARNAWTVACWDATEAARDATRTVDAAAAELEWQIARAIFYIKPRHFKMRGVVTSVNKT